MSIASLRIRAPSSQVVFAAVAALTCSVSLVLTLRLSWQVGGTGVAAAMALAVGAAWELSKYTLAPTGLRWLLCGTPRRRWAGAGLSVMSLVLVCGSLAASMGYMLATDSAAHARAVEASPEYRAAVAELAHRDVEIKLLADTARGDAAHGYRSRALQTASELRRLRAERAALQSSLGALQTAPGTSGWAALAQLLACSEGALRLAAFAVVACMLELLSIVTLMLARGAERLPASATQRSVQHERCSAGAADKRAAAPAAADDALYASIRQAIVEGRVEPVLRAVQRMANISQRPAQRYLLRLAEEGVLRRDDRGRYQLACA
jgi:hypothetical protein